MHYIYNIHQILIFVLVMEKVLQFAEPGDMRNAMTLLIIMAQYYETGKIFYCILVSRTIKNILPIFCIELQINMNRLQCC